MKSIIKKIALWGTVIVVALIGYAAKHAYDVSDQTILLAVLIAWMTVGSFQFDTRIGALEERVIHKDFSAIRLAILEGERHKPKHDQPKSLIEGGAVRSFITAAHEVLFDDFRWFGAVLNQHLSEGWAIEEINDTDVRSFDGPEVGRRYRVFYNACQMGTIQVTVGGSDWIFHPEEFADNRKARVGLELDYLRFVPFGAAHSLVTTLALYVGQFSHDSEGARERASTIANSALAGHLWESVRTPDIDTTFEFRSEGPYELLRHIVAHWKSSGIDPFEKWDGDRSWSNDKT
ncbi:hypothetical protein EOA32_21405 [Mesorhizobium sp. M1A.F.Ca.ET.072.01.1.1]|uniref:hypothetical protein n=1 Tax=Mesorhizobium sp. M1A.F.Ca.ET.072.01.1.1 TaxID=2496753 RepID=UPI000FD1BF4E|nr:hypothetical protein [Mesorhizobium sp. M1A.F.Ca.ET.072.01.1.1]RUW49791.1 hypothetical protein EOA32_21405 [Mesorhizobium sp. M1A.F.Ca.ET.072.01.1.1]TIV02913.1 MAG: hypothetical protein E5W04_10960 [Mesorhizobium sp.]